MQLPGRFQVVPGEVEWILDIAHNEPAAQVLAAQLAARPLAGAAGARTFAVIGVLRDKDAAGIAAALAPVIDRWIVCALPGERGGSAAQLAARLARAPERVELAPSVVAGCERARAGGAPRGSRGGVRLAAHGGAGARVASDILTTGRSQRAGPLRRAAAAALVWRAFSPNRRCPW